MNQPRITRIMLMGASKVPNAPICVIRVIRG
jgi:hypothetical protein